MPVREKSGNLFFDFTWQGVRCKEYTGLPDTAENRHRCQHTMRLVDAAIRRGDFEGTLHKVMGDTVEEGLIPTNPVLRIRRKKRRRAGARVRSQSDPLTPFEIATFLGTVPGFYRPLYDVWFRLGWRSSEIVALRFRNLDFTRHIITVDTGRMPRFGGIEAEPEDGSA